jgi:hypothetical protein
MKKTLGSLLAVASLVAALGCPAVAQESQGSSEQWREVEKLLGLETTYSVDMVVSVMGMEMASKVYRAGDRTRTEMTMPFMNVEMAMIELDEGGRSVSYSLFPAKKKYMLNEENGDDGDAGEMAAPTIEDLGSEVVDGIECAKKRILMSEDGAVSELLVWLSPKHKDMPVKMTVNANMPAESGMPAMPMLTTILFKNYDFGTPEASLFDVPGDYAKIDNMMEIMMEGAGGMEGLGALMQQMQDQMGE